VNRLLVTTALAAAVMLSRLPAPAATSPPLFVDATAQTGLAFTHDNGATGTITVNANGTFTVSDDHFSMECR